MSESPSTRCGDDALIAFLKELEEKPDDSSVVDKFCTLYPDCAEDFRDLFATRKVFAFGQEESAAAGPTVLGDFRVVRELARGGMGVIYEAVQEPLGRRVAVKTIRDDRLRISPDCLERFVREQDVLARLHHTNIVPIHAAGKVGPLHYFAMPLIEGAALSHVIESAWRHETTERDCETPTVAKLAEAASTAPSTLREPPSPVPPRQSKPSNGSPSTPPIRLTLSTSYLRSVAVVMAAAADAIQHAHEAKILHRDLKPTNLMVDRDEHCWVLDFGLARIRETPHGDGPRDPVAEAMTSGRMGTPLYMAPEQFDCRADERSDIWGLGVTLYELLTLRRPFDSESQIPSSEPRPMRELVTNSMLDLEAICRKAIRKDPAHRYATARDFGDDLRRWLRHEPVSARPAHVPRRVALWSRRNKGWATAILLAIFGICFLGLAGVVMGAQQRQLALRRSRESLMEHILRLRLTPHAAGWFDTTWTDVRGASQIGADDQLQGQATGLLSGLDARLEKSFDEPAATIAFDLGGKRLLMSGGPKGLRVWNHETGKTTVRADSPVGPFAIRPDGTSMLFGHGPIKATQRTSRGFPLRLTNLTTHRDERTFADPVQGGSLRVAALAISQDASLVGASVVLKDEARRLIVWNANTGEIVKKVPYQARDLAFSPDSKLIAAWDDAGHVGLWSLPEGRKLGSLSVGPNPIHTVAFSRNHWRRGAASSAASDWLLATGEAGGTVRIWELHHQQIWAVCRGSQYDVYALAFSPDGTTLASAGREKSKLWDVATGQFLLDLVSQNQMNGLAFSPDGHLLAVSSPPVWGAGAVDVWALDEGRGIRTLRGLTSQVAKAYFSRDGRLVAGISHDWRVAIWDRATGQLRRMLDVPRGDFADNSSLAFSPDGRRVAFSAGRQAKLWDIESGRELDAWKLPPGFVDALAFAGPDRLLLLRAETEGGQLRPYGNDPRIYPRVCPLRELRKGGKAETIRVIEDFPFHLNYIVASPNGSSFVIEGSAGDPGKSTRSVRAYDIKGKELWNSPSEQGPDAGSTLAFDPAGSALCLGLKGSLPFSLVRPSTGAPVGELSAVPKAMGPGGTTWIEDVPHEPFGLVLQEKGRPGPLVKLLSASPVAGVYREFSRDGRFIVWGNVDGTVNVCDLVETQRRLAGVGMGW